MQDLDPLVGEGPQPTLLVFGLLGAQQVDLVAGARAQLQCVLYGDVEVALLAVLHVHHLHLVHVHAALVVEHVPPQKVLWRTEEVFRLQQKSEGNWIGQKLCPHLFAVDHLMIEEEEHPLLALGLGLGHLGQFTGEDEVRASAEDVLTLRRREGSPVSPRVVFLLRLL